MKRVRSGASIVLEIPPASNERDVRMLLEERESAHPALRDLETTRMREAPWSAAAKLPPWNPLSKGGSSRYRTPRCLRHKHSQSDARFLVARSLRQKRSGVAARIRLAPISLDSRQ
jgi:hypothetical protein